MYAANSERQQQAVAAIADHDGFNWGYDPVHYGVPEGSYATEPGRAEFVQACLGLKGLQARSVGSTMEQCREQGFGVRYPPSTVPCFLNQNIRASTVQNFVVPVDALICYIGCVSAVLDPCSLHT